MIDLGYEENDDMCDSCMKEQQADHMVLRLVIGSSIEGVGVREVYYDKDNKIIGLGRYPLSPPGSSELDVVNDIVKAMEQLDAMLEATKQPMLDEAKLQRELGI